MSKIRRGGDSLCWRYLDRCEAGVKSERSWIDVDRGLSPTFVAHRPGWVDQTPVGCNSTLSLPFLRMLEKPHIWDHGWKDTWSRDSIIGPPVVPVAQDTDKRDLKLNFCIKDNLLERIAIFKLPGEKTGEESQPGQPVHCQTHFKPFIWKTNSNVICEQFSWKSCTCTLSEWDIRKCLLKSH